MTNDVTDEQEHADAARMLRGLPKEAPPGSLASAVVEQVRPVAVRRRRIMMGVVAAFLVAGLAYAVTALQVMSE